MGRRNNKGLRKKLVMKTEIVHVFHSCCCPKLPVLHASTKEIHADIKEALQCLFDEYLALFKHRKKLIISKSPSEEKELPTLVKRSELIQKARELIHVESFLPLYYSYSDKVQSFMGKLHREILGVQSDYLKVLCLAEAYQLALNSSHTLAEVSGEIFKDPPLITCEYITKLEFFDTVL